MVSIGLSLLASESSKARIGPACVPDHSRSVDLLSIEVDLRLARTYRILAGRMIWCQILHLVRRNNKTHVLCICRRWRCGKRLSNSGPTSVQASRSDNEDNLGGPNGLSGDHSSPSNYFPSISSTTLSIYTPRHYSRSPEETHSSYDAACKGTQTDATCMHRQEHMDC